MFTKSLLTIVTVATLTLTSQAAVLFTPVGVGTASNSTGVVDFAGMFDAQPVGLPTVGNTAVSFGAGYGFFGNVTRTGYVDFGASYASYQIESVFVGLKQFGPASTATVTYSWSADTTIGGDTAQADLGFFSTGGANSNQQWVQTFSGVAVVQQRYLLVQYTAIDIGNRFSELAIGVAAVPEPSSMALVFAGASFLAISRRRKAVRS